jgi:hypothetical protein
VSQIVNYRLLTLSFSSFIILYSPITLSFVLLRLTSLLAFPLGLHCLSGEQSTENCEVSLNVSVIYDCIIKFQSRDSAVGVATGYGLDDWGFRVRVPVGSRILSSHPASYPMGAGALSPGGKAAGA